MGKPETDQATGKGLAGVIALNTEICDIDGQKGILIYAGYDIGDLAAHCSFEEVAFLLWNGHLPTSSELQDLSLRLAAERKLPPMVMDTLRLMPEDADPMAALQTAVSILSLFDGEADHMTPDANMRKAIRLTARIPVIIAAIDRLRKGLELIDPLRDGSTASNFLYMMTGEKPGSAAERTFDACLVLHAEHGLNASTFTGRVISATLSDMYSAVTGAIGALKGPLHGGANIRVMEMLTAIDRSGQTPTVFIEKLLADKERVMGFGHRVYKTIDPRATILREMVDSLSAESGTRKWYEMSLEIMDVMATSKNLYPNVDFFSASVYATLGISTDLFTPIFAMARIAGWSAHLLEQWKDNRLIRPRAAYTGPVGLTTGRA